MKSGIDCLERLSLVNRASQLEARGRIVIVVDPSILVKIVAREEGWEEALKLLEEGAMTLDLAVKEAANALREKGVEGRDGA